VRAWNSYPSQRSAVIPLVAGHSYYLETLHKEGNGGDNLAVGWMGPAPLNTTNVIAAAYLKPPFTGFSPPRFATSPFTEPAALANVPYAGSLADQVTDTNANELLVFTKLSGPAWIVIAADGTLTGLPGPGDLGTNTFTVRVVDSTGFSADAQGRIFVASPPAIVPGATFAGGNLSFQFTGLVNQHYRVEFTAALPAVAPWQVLTDIVQLAESPFTVNDPTGSAQRFYRVSLIP